MLRESGFPRFNPTMAPIRIPTTFRIVPNIAGRIGGESRGLNFKNAHRDPKQEVDRVVDKAMGEKRGRI